MNALRRIAAAAATAAGLVLLAYASAVSLPFREKGVAALRLSWSARPERIEVCRTLSAEEQARRAEHMRQRVECEGTFATYALRVDVDGRTLGESVLQGAGLRHDRSMYLLRNYPVPPGQHRVVVTLARREDAKDSATALVTALAPDVDTGLYAGRAQREASERSRRTTAAIPRLLQLDTTLVFATGRVVLVTFNAERRTLELYGNPVHK